MPGDVSIDTRGEAFIDGACVIVEERILLDRDAINALCREVAIHAVAAKPFPVFAARAKQSERNTRAVIFKLDIGEGIRGCPKILRADMGNPICGSNNLDLSAGVGRPD
jgi:hypothetical protein